MSVIFLGPQSAENGTNVNYIDFELRWYDSNSNYQTIDSATIFKIWMKPTSDNLYPYFQLLNSSGTAQNLSYQSIYQYASTLSRNYSNNTTAISTSYGCYNDSQANHEGTHIYLQGQSKASNFDDSNILKASVHHFRSSYAFHEYFTILPYYSLSSNSEWATARLYFNNTSSANIADYKIFAGV